MAAAINLAPLVASGIAIVPDENAPIGAGSAGPLVMTDVQARRLMADTSVAAGVLGSDLDTVAPVEAGVPPMSFVVAAWISQGTSPAASAARAIVGDEDWTQAPQDRFPWAVVAMFVNDVLSHANDALPSAPGSSVAIASSAVAPAGLKKHTESVGAGRPAVLAGPCSAVSGFLASVFDKLFEAIKPPPGSGTVVNVLALLGTIAIGLAKNVVQGLISVVTAPVLAAFKVGIAALGVATLVVSFFKDQTLTVTLDPVAKNTDVYRFAVGAEAPVTGVFVAKGKELTSDWPPALVDCANATGETLPKLIEPGADATWTVSNDFGVIVPGPLTTKVGQDLTARLEFTTGAESVEQAKGEVTFDPAVATVKVPRQAVDAFLDFARQRVDDAKAALLANIPPGPARDAAAAAAKQILDPSIDQLAAAAKSQLNGAFSLTGTGVVVVKHHTPPPPTTLPSSTTTTPPQAFVVHLDRPAKAPLQAGRVVDLHTCDGLFGHWTGVIRDGGINGAGISQPFHDFPVDFTVGGSDVQTVHTMTAASIATQIGPVDISLSLDITVDDTRLLAPTMSINGTGTASGQVVAVSEDLGAEASNMPIEKAPAGTCP